MPYISILSPWLQLSIFLFQLVGKKSIFLNYGKIPPPPSSSQSHILLPSPLPVRLDRNLEFDLVNVEDSAEYCGNCVFLIRIEFRLCSVSDLPVTLHFLSQRTVELVHLILLFNSNLTRIYFNSLRKFKILNIRYECRESSLFLQWIYILKINTLRAG